MKLYGDHQSGNCYKVELLAALIGLDLDFEPVDILQGDTRSATFLARNPAGKIPVLELDDGQYLTESNAILYYLSQGTSFWPQDDLIQSQVLAWQFFEQYSHEPYIAVARFINFYLGMPEDRAEEFQQKQAEGHRALARMEKALAHQSFLVGDRATIADISLYAYTHVAHEGGFDLSQYLAINRWLERIRSLDGYKAMQRDN